MFQSHVIEVNGTFIGAAVTTTDGFRFRAVHPRVDELDGRVWETLPELRRATGHLSSPGASALWSGPPPRRIMPSGSSSPRLQAPPAPNARVACPGAPR